MTTPPKTSSSSPQPEIRTDSTSPTRLTTTPSDPEVVRKFALETAQLVADDKCTDVVLLDVTGISPVTDYIVIASGTSDRQMRSVLDHVAELGAKAGYSAYRSNSDERATWLLVDFVDLVVHLFEPNTRSHYDLEMLWGDAKRVDWERPAAASTRNRAGLSADDVL
jgi:ribosome-associated protein